jgi:hypothetical protein
VQIKVAAVNLAKLYMKRVAWELDNLGNTNDKEPVREFFLLQGVRFAFRVHQVCKSVSFFCYLELAMMEFTVIVTDQVDVKTFIYLMQRESKLVTSCCFFWACDVLPLLFEIVFLQFAGGFDPESMKVFEDLRNRAHKKETPVQESPAAAVEAAESVAVEG